MRGESTDSALKRDMLEWNVPEVCVHVIRKGGKSLSMTRQNKTVRAPKAACTSQAHERRRGGE